MLVDPPQLGLQVRTAPIILFELGLSHISEKKINFLSKTIFTYFCLQRMRLRALGAQNLVDEHLLELGVDILDDTRHLLVLGGSDSDD